MVVAYKSEAQVYLTCAYDFNKYISTCHEEPTTVIVFIIPFMLYPQAYSGLQKCSWRMRYIFFLSNRLIYPCDCKEYQLFSIHLTPVRCVCVFVFAFWRKVFMTTSCRPRKQKYKRHKNKNCYMKKTSKLQKHITTKKRYHHKNNETHPKGTISSLKL